MTVVIGDGAVLWTEVSGPGLPDVRRVVLPGVGRPPWLEVPEPALWEFL